MEIYNKKPYVTTIVILIILILGLGGYIAYDKLLAKKEEAKVVTIVNDVKINLNAFYQISSTLEKLDTAFNNNSSNYFGYIYKNKKLSIKNFDPNALLYASVASDLIPSNTNQSIPGNKVKGNYQKMFGTNVKYNPITIIMNDTIKINYDKVNDIYTYNIPVNTSNYKSGYITTNTKTVLEEDQIIITRKVFYVEYNGNGNDATKADVYTNSNKDYRLGSVSIKNGQANVYEVISKYGSRLNTFEYTFIKNSDEDYTLYRIEKIK